ncbi:MULTISPECIES: hypothetical protein [unclassified Pseudomonas]|uniref:hypothetical protein n=1 Tax=unclassified Pseudomonas TaxID=196821 RepID=UPI000BDBE322|nr:MULTISPECIES: hypothetical protein [unclassified Pseudomonas]PVZ20007.1 hypothetical protein F474_00599 [Pseudomonas sp. URIL14HWK12:I12]PVZ27073.1 hypothetical protein F470_00254 [Pseudomonas sp. URIL14HWK12:I10]PVZ37962.1 hypothetical protein F472_00599 [Pseudomonas sp. URIL14HWK12:I11]SNZ04971.1 hypothetical protein SAMN05660463_00805 [Pseudomonas sp. URIL14HWK12:I9]
MQITAALLMGNPCDEEEDNLALLACQAADGRMFLMSRYPGEDEVDIAFDEDEPAGVKGLSVSLSATSLDIEVQPEDADLFGGDRHLQIAHTSDAADLDELTQALEVILKGVGQLTRH